MATKTLILRPLAIISSTGWNGATIANIDPLFPIAHDDAATFASYEQPPVGDKLTVSLRDKPNDIQSVTTVSVLVRDAAQDGRGTIGPSVELQGASANGSTWTNTVGVWTDRESAVLRPGGGAWTPQDIADPTFYASVRVTAWIDPPSASLFERVTSGPYVKLVYESIPIQDDGARDAASRRQWFFLTRPRVLKRRLPVADAMRVDLLDVVRVSHRDGPQAQGLGWRSEPWQTRPHRLVGRRTNLMTNMSEVRFRDLRPQLCLMRYSARAKSPAAIADGVSFFAAGSALEFTRSSLAWVMDRDGLVERVDVDQPTYAGAAMPSVGEREFGLLLEGAAKNIVLESGFARGATDTFTSWEEDDAGTGSITEDTSILWWKPTVVPRVARLDMDSGGTGGALLKQTHPETLAGSAVVGISIAHYDEGDTLEYALRREVDNQFYDWSTGAFSASPTQLWYEVPLSDGEWARHFIGAVNVGTNPTQLRSFIGRDSTRVTTTQTNRVAHFQIAEGDAAGMTSPILTDKNGLTRAASAFKITNDSGARCVTVDKGAVGMAWVPDRDAADFLGDQVVWTCAHDGNNSIAISWSDGNSRWEVAYKAAGNTYTAHNAADPPARGVRTVLLSRYTGAAGELGLPNHTLDLFVNGVKGTSATKVTLTEAAESDVILEASGAVHQDLQNLAYPPTDEECARLPRR